MAATFNFALALADDALVLGHRLSEWSGKAPTLEEDIALSNLGLDLIGQARLLYAYAGAVEGRGRDEDQLAYFREAPQFRNVLLVEQPIGDFAFTMARQLLYAAFMQPYFQAMSSSKDPRLAEIAAKAVKEMAYHARHAAEWVIRMGDGTEESRRRIIEAFDAIWPYTSELFGTDASERELIAAGVAPDRKGLRGDWERVIDQVLREATLERPPDGPQKVGGRAGRHGEHLVSLLTDMQSIARAHPGATW